MFAHVSPWPAHFLLFSANQLQEKDHIQRGIFSITHTFVRLIPITWWEEIAVQNVYFTKSVFIFRTLNNTDQNIDTKWCKFQMLADSQEIGDCRKHWPGCTCTLKPDQKLHCLSQNAFWKTAWPNGTWIYTLIWVSPMFENQSRMHKQRRLISLYICNVWSAKCFLDNFEK